MWAGTSQGFGGAGSEQVSRQVGGERAPVLCPEGREQRVLFIGNSYTHYFEMPRLLAAMAASAGCQLEVDYVAPGGSRLKMHAQSGQTLSAIGRTDWDAVVLQNFSQLPSQPLSRVARESLPHVKQLVDAILNNNPDTSIHYYVTWGRRDGDKKNCANNPVVCTFEGHTEALHRGYGFYAEKLGGSLVDVGGAWARIKRDASAAFPHRRLYDKDGSHPSLRGSYLAASVFFAALFGHSPQGLSYPDGLSPRAARYIQSIASTVPVSGA